MEGKWKNLPKDILGDIAKCLGSTGIEILRLRAVCSTWRTSLPLLKLSPFQVSCQDKIASLSATDSKHPPCYDVKKRTTFLVSPPENYANTSTSSTPSWIIQVVETSPRKLSLRDPFSYRSENCFPKIVELPDSFNLVNYKITEINQSYFFDFGEASKSNWKADMVEDAILVDTNDESFILFILELFGTLAYRKHGMKEWVPIIKGNGSDGCLQMVRYKNRIYAFEYSGGLTVFDVFTCEIIQKNVPFPCRYMMDVPCLGEFNGHLYLVTYHRMYGTSYIDLRVHILDEENETWEPKIDLGGGVFLVHHTTIFCLSAKDVNFLKGDCIYFYCCNRKRYSCTGCIDECTLVYDLHARKSSVYDSGLNRAPFWPPPHWFKEIEESSQ